MSQQPFGDIPLFREIERILASSEGPINFEIARQVGTAAATGGAADPTPDPEVVHAFSDAVHTSEEYLAGYTRQSADEPARISVVGKSRWVSSTLESWRWLLERLANRFGSQMAEVQGPEEGAEGNQLQAMIGNIAPLLLGIQVGTMIGQLANTAVGRYDLPIPRDDEGTLFFVDPNITAIASDYDLDPDRLRRWLALHHGARHLVATSVPWLIRYLKGLLAEIVDSIEVDLGDIEKRLADLQTQGPDALQTGMGASDLLPIVQTERRKRANDRLLAFVALWEGYARHAGAEVGERLVPDAARISESMARRAIAPNEGEAMMAGVLGLTIDRALQASGQTFCAAVVSLKGLPSLNEVWAAPDNLPSLDEIKDPFQWMERVLGDGDAEEDPTA